MSLFTPSAKVPSHFPCSLNFHQRTNEDVTGEGNRAYVKTVTDLFVRSRPGLWSGGSGGFRSRWQRPTRRLRLLPRPGTRHGDTRCSYWDGRHADALRPRLPEYRAASLRQTRTGSGETSPAKLAGESSTSEVGWRGFSWRASLLIVTPLSGPADPLWSRNSHQARAAWLVR
jgi:hypothetical protein